MAEKANHAVNNFTCNGDLSQRGSSKKKNYMNMAV